MANFCFNHRDYTAECVVNTSALLTVVASTLNLQEANRTMVKVRMKLR